MARRKNTFKLAPISASKLENKRIMVVESFRQAVQEGRLLVGDQIPSSRDLASQWAISRGIVVAAYEELQAEGILETRFGSGTFVALNPSTQATEEFEFRPEQSNKHIRIQHSQPFIARQASVEYFPMQIWRKLAAHVLNATNQDIFYDQNAAGDHTLREQVARYLGFARGINCTVDDIIITTGIRHSIDLTLRIVAIRDATIITESPGYAGIESLAESLGIHEQKMPVDDKGMVITELNKLSPAPKLCFTTPSHQSPIGVQLSVERREALLRWAIENDSYIFEDDYDGEFSFDSGRLPTLKSADLSDRVIHAGSFNKSLFPTLRIGYLVAPRSLNAKFINLRSITGRANSTLEQKVLAKFISEGHFARYIRKLNTIYANKCNRLISSISKGYSGQLDVLGSHGGFHFFLKLPNSINIEMMTHRALQVSITLQTSSYKFDGKTINGIVIGYSSLDEAIIDEFGLKLGRILRECSEP